MCWQAQVMTLLETQGQSRHPRHIGTTIPQLSALLPPMELTPKLMSTSSPVL